MNRRYQLDLTQGPILTRLLQFSLPIILSGVLQLLFNAADIIVVGQFAGDASLAAVGSTSSLVNLLVNLFMGLSIGTNVVAANFFGAGKKEELKKTVHTSILVSLYSGIILTVIGVLGAKQILKLMQSPPEVLKLATLYLQIFFGGITSTMIYNFGSALLRAKGDTQRPLYILFITGLINVILNLIFVIPLKMDVAGVAIATIISQTVAAVLIIGILLKEDDDFKLDLRKLKIERDIFIRIVKIGIPAGFQGIMFSLSNVLIQSSINTFGALAIAGNSASSSIEGFVYTSMNGFAQGTLTFASQNYGASKYDRIKKLLWTSLSVVTVIGLVLGFLVIFLQKPLIGFYSKSPETMKAASVRLTMICASYFLCGIMDVMGNLLRGIGHSVLPMIVTMIGVCGVRILWIVTVFQIPQFHKMEVIYLSYPITWILTFAVHLICFLILYKQMTVNKNSA